MLLDNILVSARHSEDLMGTALPQLFPVSKNALISAKAKLTEEEVLLYLSIGV